MNQVLSRRPRERASCSSFQSAHRSTRIDCSPSFVVRMANSSSNSKYAGKCLRTTRGCKDREATCRPVERPRCSIPSRQGSWDRHCESRRRALSSVAIAARRSGPILRSGAVCSKTQRQLRPASSESRPVAWWTTKARLRLPAQRCWTHWNEPDEMNHVCALTVVQPTSAAQRGVAADELTPVRWADAVDRSRERFTCLRKSERLPLQMLRSDTSNSTGPLGSCVELAVFYKRNADADPSTLTFWGVRHVAIPRRDPWGPSVFVNSNTFTPPDLYTIEVQSGD